MDCGDVRRELLGHPYGPNADVHAAMAAHAVACPACCSLLADGGTLARRLVRDGTALDIEATLGAVEKTVAAERGLRAALRNARTSVRLSLAAAVAGSSVLAVLTLRPRADLGLYPKGRLLAAVLILALLAGAALLRGLRPSHLPSLATWRTALLLVAAVLAPIVLALLPPAHTLTPLSLGGGGDDLVGRALACLGFGLAAALVPGVALWLIDRGTGPSRWLAAAAAAGLVGTLALELHCPLTGPAHLLLGHATVSLVAVAAVAGAVLRPRS
jgi:hypothetical protein